MALFKKSAPKIDKAQLYVCLDSHRSAAGSFKQGQVVRGSEPGVRLHPDLWLPWTDDEAELLAARQAYIARSAPPTAPAGPTTSDGIPIFLSRPITDPAQLAVCVKPVPMTGAGYGLRMPIPVGTVLARTDQVVRGFPSHFRSARAADIEGQAGAAGEDSAA